MADLRRRKGKVRLRHLLDSKITGPTDDRMVRRAGLGSRRPAPPGQARWHGPWRTRSSAGVPA